MRGRRRCCAALGLVAATTLLTACGSGTGGDAGPAPGPVSGPDSGPAPGADPGTRSAGATTAPTSGSPSAQRTGTPTPPGAAGGEFPRFPSGTAEQFAQHKGAWDLVLRDVRVDRHDGFDRVVAEFRGTGVPGWAAHYVRTPRAEGSGEIVEVRGDDVLAVSISGVTFRQGYPDTPADLFRGVRHFSPERGGAIEDVNVLGVFEGYSQLFLGVDGGAAPFRVFALTHPSRLVVDVVDVEDE